MPEESLSRRAFLLAGVSAAAACTRSPSSPPALSPAPRGGSTPGSADADAGVRARAVDAERALLARYEATLHRHPTLRSRLAPFAAEHRAHLRALEPAGGPGAGPVAGGQASRRRRSALQALARAERAAAGARVEDAVDATAPGLAELLAAVGGCEASHAALLGAGDTG